MQKTLRRPVVAVAALAAGATLALSGCSSDSNDTASAVSSAATAATSAVVSGTETASSSVDDLSTQQAQDILRKAVDANTPADQLSTVVDTSTPGTEQAISGFAKGSAAGGYTPDVYTVKSVTEAEDVDGHDAAKVTVAVKSPHAPQPVDIELTYVEIDDTWKLSADAVSTLSGMAGPR